MSSKQIEYIEWNSKDFIVKEMKLNEWIKYEKKYPNLLWGTCIIEKKENKIVVVKRFIDKETCQKYCTAPVSFDFTGGL